MTEAVREAARKLLKTQPNEARKTLNMMKFFRSNTLSRYHEQWLRETVKIKHITMGKNLVQNGATEDKYISFGSKMILTRYLWHKDEIPGSAQW